MRLWRAVAMVTVDAKETATAAAHAVECERYEGELRMAAAREAVVRAEIQPLEFELSTHTGVYQARALPPRHPCATPHACAPI